MSTRIAAALQGWFARCLMAGIAAGIVIGAALPAATTASAMDPVTALIGRGIFRAIHHDVRRDRAIGQINAERDADLKDVNKQQSVLDFQRKKKWLDEEAYRRESDRLAALRTGIAERAKRERQITNYDTRRAIRNDLADTVEGVLTAGTGLDRGVVNFIGGIVRGEKPLNAAMSALAASQQGGGGPQPAQLQALQEQLARAREALRVLRNPNSPEAAAELQDAIRRAAGLGEGAEGRTPSRVAKEIAEIQERIAKAEEFVGRLKATAADLFPNDIRVNKERFASDEKWLAANASIQASSVSTAEKAVIAGAARATAERVDAMLRAAGIELDDDDLASLAAGAGAAYVRARIEGGGGPNVNIDDIVRKAINEQLAAAGRPPLPEPGEAAVSSAGSGAAAAAAAATGAAPPVPQPTAASGATAPTVGGAPAATPTRTATRAATAQPTAAPAATATRTAAPTATRTSPPAATATPQPFRITNVSYPSTIKSGGAKGSLTVTWSGEPKFPVTMTYRVKAGGCPAGSNCTNPSKSFSSSANPLVFADAVWCVGVTQTLTFGYEVVMTDSNGKTTNAFGASFTCNP